jgi:hypothetical protein
MPRKGTPYQRQPGVKPRYINPDELKTPNGYSVTKERRLTARQQHFLELYASCNDRLKAGKEAGLSKPSVYRLLQLPLAQQYLLSIRAEARAIAAYDVSTAMQEASDAMVFAKERQNPMAYVKAVELRSKLSGLLIDRVQVEKIDITKALSEAQARVVEVPRLELPVTPHIENGIRSTTETDEKLNEINDPRV